MGTIIAFPANAASRLGTTVNRSSDHMRGTVVILPVIRIDRATDGGSGPEEGTAAGRRRRRRARS